MEYSNPQWKGPYQNYWMWSLWFSNKRSGNLKFTYWRLVKYMNAMIVNLLKNRYKVSKNLWSAEIIFSHEGASILCQIYHAGIAIHTIQEHLLNTITKPRMAEGSIALPRRRNHPILNFHSCKTKMQQHQQTHCDGNCCRHTNEIRIFYLLNVTGLYRR